jgi:hypothetical protein
LCLFINYYLLFVQQINDDKQQRRVSSDINQQQLPIETATTSNSERSTPKFVLFIYLKKKCLLIHSFDYSHSRSSSPSMHTFANIASSNNNGGGESTSNQTKKLTKTNSKAEVDDLVPDPEQ